MKLLDLFRLHKNNKKTDVITEEKPLSFTFINDFDEYFKRNDNYYRVQSKYSNEVVRIIYKDETKEFGENKNVIRKLESYSCLRLFRTQEGNFFCQLYNDISNGYIMLCSSSFAKDIIHKAHTTKEPELKIFNEYVEKYQTIFSVQVFDNETYEGIYERY